MCIAIKPQCIAAPNYAEVMQHDQKRSISVMHKLPCAHMRTRCHVSLRNIRFKYRGAPVAPRSRCTMVVVLQTACHTADNPGSRGQLQSTCGAAIYLIIGSRSQAGKHAKEPGRTE